MHYHRPARFNFLKYILFIYLLCVFTHPVAHVEVRGQLVGIGVLLPPSGSQGSNSALQS